MTNGLIRQVHKAPGISGLVWMFNIEYETQKVNSFPSLWAK